MTADLTTEATLQPTEWGAIQMPLGRNLRRDGGFEGAFARSDIRGRLPVSGNQEPETKPYLAFSASHLFTCSMKASNFE